MDIEELLNESIAENDINLQALIMFLVFEKQVLSMEQSISELDLYFLKKHEQRMGDELIKFKEKMNMKEPAAVYKVHTQDKTLYIYAQNEWQARSFVKSLEEQATSTSYAPGTQLMLYEDKYRTLNEIVKGKQAPHYIGENKTEINYWRNRT